MSLAMGGWIPQPKPPSRFYGCLAKKRWWRPFHIHFILFYWSLVCIEQRTPSKMLLPHFYHHPCWTMAYNYGWHHHRKLCRPATHGLPLGSCPFYPWWRPVLSNCVHLLCPQRVNWVLRFMVPIHQICKTFGPFVSCYPPSVLPIPQCIQVWWHHGEVCISRTTQTKCFVHHLSC